jgi:hypothetical protein
LQPRIDEKTFMSPRKRYREVNFNLFDLSLAQDL